MRPSIRRPFVNRTLVMILALATAAPLLAQRKPATPAEPQPQPLVEQIEVRIIDVDVVVQDRRGNFIPGLKKEDFEILENGVPKTVSNFYEVEGNRAKNLTIADEVGGKVTAPAAAAAVPEEMKRRIIFYIDNLSLNPFNRNRVFQQMRSFLKSAMRPGDEAMIATYNRSMKVRVPFTRDIGQIESIL